MRTAANLLVYASLCGWVSMLVGACSAIVSADAQDDMFSAADAYERFMGRWSRQLAPALVRFAAVRDGEKLLDVGSGTGALADALAKAAPASRIVGIDPSAAYVRYAQARHGGERTAFETGDAQRLRFADASFDRTLSLLVLNFVPDRENALREMARVTRPGGVVAAAVWDYDAGMEMLRTFWDTVTALDASAAARDERRMPLCRKGELARFWTDHGFADVVEEPLTIQTRFASFEDFWGPFLEQQGPAGTYVASLDATAREKLRRALRARVQGDGKDGPIVMQARAWAVRGTVRGQ